MSASALVFWWGCIALEFIILVRAVRSRIIRTYPFFCAYLAVVLVGDLGLFCVYRLFTSGVYQYSYWIKEFVCVIAGYCVVFEIIQVGLAFYEGPKRFARNAALLVFAGVVGFTAVQSAVEHALRLVLTSVEVERNLRSAELVLLGLVIALVAYYGIPMGKSLKGIFVGYGFNVAVLVMTDSFRSHAGPAVGQMLSYIRSYSYLVSLVIWVIALWSYRPNAVPEVLAQPAVDYEALAADTKKAIDAVRSDIEKAARL
jgi:hypothetical protein